MGTRFALVGDIHGRFEVLSEALDVARGRQDEHVQRTKILEQGHRHFQ